MRAFLVPNARPGSRMDSMYSLPIYGMGAEELEDEKRRLTLQGKTNFGPPLAPFKVYKVEDGRLYVPRFYGLQRFGPPETDVCCEGEKIDITFVGELRDVQERAMTTLFGGYFKPNGSGGAITVLPCGFGKTVLAVAAAVKNGRKTGVLVHTAVLKTQWKNSFEQFCPGVRVGYIQGATLDIEGKDVVIMMVQTVAKRQFSYDVTDCFGLLICDEAHHMAAPIMNMALRCFRSQNILALTATKERPDGLTHLLHWSLGPEAFRAERTSEAVRVTIVNYNGAAMEKVTKDGRPLVAIMLNHLGIHTGRNRFIAQRVYEMRKKGRTMIVLSHRCAQLQALRRILRDHLKVDEEQIGILEAGMKEESREIQMSRPILLCSYNMADEGLDKRTLDTCVMATPKSRVEQCIGRIQRPCDTKQSPLVVDIADDGVYYGRLRQARHNFYRKNQYETQIVNATDETTEHWFE